jgi:sarcosine/dimethylglycine N-methyltransferase
MTLQQSQPLAQVTEHYYDSTEADEFYFNIWGGEDIHVGIYTGERSSIREASRATVERIASMLPGLSARTRVLDLGAGYGGAARWLAETYGARVCCLNLSERQNARNRELTRTRRLEDRIEVVHGDFEHIPKADEQFDVVWSQDAILHSGNRMQVLREVARVLAPGGHFVFTDPMQVDDCPPGALDEVLARIHLQSLGSFLFYRRAARELGLHEVTALNLTPHLVRHYERVREELETRYDDIVRRSTRAYVDRMIHGLGHWIHAGRRGYLTWGILHLSKPS